MKNKMEYIWNGRSGFVPKLGEVQDGQPVLVPTGMVGSLKKQGLIVEPKKQIKEQIK